MEVDDVHPDHV